MSRLISESGLKVLIHFGVHRTGTTFIQRNLAKNQLILGKNGILYPDIQGRTAHVRLPNLLSSNMICLSDVIEEIENQLTPAIHTVILSSENFCYSRSHEALKQLAAKSELYAILYLRRQDLWLESWYNQHVKWPWSDRFSGSSFDYFLKTIDDFQWIDYRQLLDGIEQFISRDRMHVSVLDELGLQNSFADFLQYCGINSRLLEIEKTGRNSSLTSAKIDILRRIDIFGLPPAARKKVIRELRKMDIKEDNGKSKFLTDRQRKRVIKKFTSSNRYVAQRYFARDKLFSDYVSDNVTPAFVSDETAYRKYIPELLKKIAEE